MQISTKAEHTVRSRGLPSIPLGWLAESGRPNPTARAFSYTRDWTGVDEREAAAIREGYAMILAGGSLYSVAKQWNAEGITTSQGNTWTGKTVRQNLLNSRNAALRSYQGEVLEGVTAAWPAIVTEDVWRSVVAILTDSERQPGCTARKHLLSGIALCGNCNTPLGRASNATPRGRCTCARNATRFLGPPI